MMHTFDNLNSFLAPPPVVPLSSPSNVMDASQKLEPPWDPWTPSGPIKSPQRAPFSHILNSLEIRYAKVYPISDVPKTPVKSTPQCDNVTMWQRDDWVPMSNIDLVRRPCPETLTRWWSFYTRSQGSRGLQIMPVFDFFLNGIHHINLEKIEDMIFFKKLLSYCRWWANKQMP